MATSYHSATKKKPPPTKEASAPPKKGAASTKKPAAPPAAAIDEDDGGKLVREYIAGLSPLTKAERSAFLRQCPAVKADVFGARTRAVNVLHDGERFARVIRGALDAPRGGLAYGKARFRYFLEELLALRAAIETDTGKGRALGKARMSVAVARARAVLARETLVERLGAYAEGDEGHAAELSGALGNTKDDDALLRSLASLVDLARHWLGNEDAESQALAASVSLDDAIANEAAGARVALSKALGSALGGGPRLARDSPETNRAEGRVLFEMRYAMRLFEGAHGRDALSPRLVPGPGTRSVLSRSERAQPAETPPAPATGSAPAAGGAPPAG